MNVNILSSRTTWASVRNAAYPAKRPFEEVPIGGITPFTSIDFPGHLAAVLFTQGCPWRCLYCHNPSLQPLEGAGGTLPASKLQEFLECRKGLLDGIVISGGEPTIHRELPLLVERIRSMGFKTALHTNGMFPERLRHVLPLCDFVAMDIKAPLEDYDRITLTKGSCVSIRQSIRAVLDSGRSYEFRSTAHPSYLSEEAVHRMAQGLAEEGVQAYVLQNFQERGCRNADLMGTPRSDNYPSKDLQHRLRKLFVSFLTRP